MIDLIVPVYNTPLKDMERCLNSILNQTFKNYKVYIIDDGSNRETREYLDSYIKDKSNFIVKHIENNGVSNARNIGIEISNSNYIAFVDADDTVENCFLEEAYNIIINNNLDLIIGGYNEIRDNIITKVRLAEPGLHIYKGKKIDNFMKKLLTSETERCNKEIGDCPTGRIYTRLFKRSSIGNLRFDVNVHMSEDTLFMVDYTKQANKIGIIDRIWYNYYKNNYSISNATKKEKMIKNVNGFINEVTKRMNIERNIDLKKAYLKRIKKSNDYINRLKSR